MKHIIIGTAGHIDHGKTTLIRALTGRNTDRLKEEQQRGITIDLGFTYFDLPNGSRVGIIDVPGHEKFINNMTAGVIGMDMVLLVIAADEGIMPQTREHIDILGLLGVEKSILVLNKCDLVDTDWKDMVKEDIREELKGSFLEGAPLVEVSAATGAGIDQLVDTIQEMTEHEIQEKDIHTIPRLPIDRVFSMSGFGTIVTGTLVSGQIHKDDTLELFPDGKTCKVRCVQVHGDDESCCFAGQRTALNLNGVRKNEVRRGCVLAPPGSMEPTTMVDVRLSVLPDSKRILENRSRLHFYTGTAEVLCRAVLLDADELKPGESCYAQLHLEDTVAVRKDDRFIVRFYSPMETIGGGVILETNPGKKKRRDEEALDELKAKESGSGSDIIELLIKEHSKSAVTAAEAAKLSAMSVDEIREITKELAEEGRIGVFPMKKDEYYWHKDFEYEMSEKIRAKLREYHEKHPYRPGISKSEIYSTFLSQWKNTAYDALIDSMVSDGKLVRRGEYIQDSDFSIPHDEVYGKISADIMKKLAAAGYDFLRFDEFDYGSSDRGTAEDVMMLLIAEEKVNRITGDFLVSHEMLEDMITRVREKLADGASITLGEVRDMFGTSRKIALPFLEYLDECRITKRRGDERILY